MPETYLSFGQNTLFCRHSTILEGRPSLLFIHGLGDSGFAFTEIFADHRFDGFNVIVPDLLGYGRSSHSPTRNYSFDLHTDCLWKIIEYFQLENITLVGHSMGGDLGTLLCWQQDNLERLQPPSHQRKIRHFLNVEGNLTEGDLFISKKADEATRGKRFTEWLACDFTYHKVYGEWCQQGAFGRRYLASLQFCDPAAFQQNAIELYKRNGPEAFQPSGILYRELSIPTLFVFGQTSLSPESRASVSQHRMRVYEVVESDHWPMIDCTDDFYEILSRFCRDEAVGGPMVLG